MWRRSRRTAFGRPSADWETASGGLGNFRKVQHKHFSRRLLQTSKHLNVQTSIFSFPMLRSSLPNPAGAEGLARSWGGGRNAVSAEARRSGGTRKFAEKPRNGLSRNLATSFKPLSVAFSVPRSGLPCRLAAMQRIAEAWPRADAGLLANPPTARRARRSPRRQPLPWSAARPQALVARIESLAATQAGAAFFTACQKLRLFVA